MLPCPGLSLSHVSALWLHFFVDYEKKPRNAPRAMGLPPAVARIFEKADRVIALELYPRDSL